MDSKLIRVLLVDDDEDDYLLTSDLFSEIKRASYQVDWASTYEEALKIIGRNHHDVCLIDYRLGQFSGLDLIKNALKSGFKAPMILLTGQGDSEVDMEAMQAGAMDYLVKGQLDAPLLERSIRYAINRKHAEEELRASEKRFKDIAYSSSDWIWEVDIDGVYTYASGNVVDVLGYRPEELLGKTPFDLMTEEQAEKIKEAFVEIALKKDNIVDLVNWNMHKDGRPVCLQTNGVPILDDDGSLIGYRGIDKDITERKQTEELIRRSEEKYRNLVENISDGVITADLNEIILFANKTSCEILGYTINELVGMNFKEVVIKEDQEKIDRGTQKRKSKEHSKYEITVIRKDGQLRQIFVSATPLLGDDENVYGTVGIFTDITDLKKAEKEKQELREKLIRAQRMESIGVLAGGVAHDLNNILGPLVAYPEMIKMKLPEDSPIRNDISKIEKSAQRASEVVQDLLTMARRGRYEMVPLDLKDLIESYMQSPDFLSLKSKHSEVNIRMEFDKALPKAHGSAAHLSKVIMNLVINALEAMPQGGELAVRTEHRYVEKLIGGFDNIDVGEYIVITVSDTGLGIEEKYFKHLFEPFYTKKAMGKSGSGLGLAIVYGVIKDHNGYIDVQSKLNQGTDFIVYLPVIDIDFAEEKEAVVDIRGSEKILIVDDIQEQRELAATLLSSLGYNVEIAPEANRRWNILRTTEPML